MRRTSASFSARATGSPPSRRSALRRAAVGPRRSRSSPSSRRASAGIVVRDRGLEPLALGRRLAQLPSQPAEEADRLLVDRLRHSAESFVQSCRRGHAARDRQPSRRAADVARAVAGELVAGCWTRAGSPARRATPSRGRSSSPRPGSGSNARRARSTSRRTSSMQASSSRSSSRQGARPLRRGPRRPEHPPRGLGGGIASCPNGIKDPELARAALAAADEETPVIVLSFGFPSDRGPGAPHGRGVERAGQSQADRRRRPGRDQADVMSLP